MKGTMITAEVDMVVEEATIIIVVSMEIVIPAEVTIMTEVMGIQIGVVKTIKTILTVVVEEEAMEIRTKVIKVTIIVAEEEETVEDTLQEVTTANRTNRDRTMVEVIIHPIINVIKNKNIVMPKNCKFIECVVE